MGLPGKALSAHNDRQVHIRMNGTIDMERASNVERPDGNRARGQLHIVDGRRTNLVHGNLFPTHPGTGVQNVECLRSGNDLELPTFRHIHARFLEYQSQGIRRSGGTTAVRRRRVLPLEMVDNSTSLSKPFTGQFFVIGQSGHAFSTRREAPSDSFC